MLAETTAFFEYLSIAGGVTTLLLVVGLVAGQFRRGVVQELRDSLKTAADEIALQRERGDRLEKTVADMQARLAAMETENRILRETLQTGLRLAPEFKDAMAELLKRHEERSEAMLARTALEVATKVAESEARREERVREAHRRLAEALPHEVGEAMKKTLL